MSTRLLYDSVDADSIPSQAAGMMGYVDGDYPSYAGMVVRFPNSAVISITVRGAPGARMADCERGAMTPFETAGWMAKELNAKRRPSAYVSTGDYPYTKAGILDEFPNSFDQTKVDFFAAQWDRVQEIPAGYVGKQFASYLQLGTGYDLSIAEATWVTPWLPPAKPPVSPVPSKEDLMNIIFANGTYVCVGVAPALAGENGGHPLVFASSSPMGPWEVCDVADDIFDELKKAGKPPQFYLVQA